MSAFKKFWKKHLFPALYRFVLFVLGVAFTIATCVLVQQLGGVRTETYANAKFKWSYKPTDLPINSSYDDYTVLLDGHSHTTFSDGKLTPEQNIEWHIANGYNAIVITDHNGIEGAIKTREIARAKYDDKIKVILGQEYSCCRVHMNLIGITSLIPSVGWPTNDQLKTTIDQVHSQGGIVSINHRGWSSEGDRLKDRPSLQELLDMGVDYIEVAHEDYFDYQGLVFAQKNGMGIISGTDMHRPTSGVYGWTTLKPTAFTEEAILEELKSRRSSLIFTIIESPYSVSPEIPEEYNRLAIFLILAEVVSNFYYASHGMWGFNRTPDGRGVFCDKKVFFLEWRIIVSSVAWFIAAFIFFEMMRQIIKAIPWKRIGRRFRRGGNKNVNGEESPLLELSPDQIWQQ